MRHLVDEIGRGYATDTLRAELHAGEQRQRALAAELASLSRKPTDATLDAKRLRRELRQRAADVRTLVAGGSRARRSTTSTTRVPRARDRVVCGDLAGGDPTPEVVTPGGSARISAMKVRGVFTPAA
jgi:hypothetical protein